VLSRHPAADPRFGHQGAGGRRVDSEPWVSVVVPELGDARVGRGAAARNMSMIGATRSRIPRVPWTWSRNWAPA
jgi:hypothetical protein